ncbi:MAG TPA: hypothetical protein PKA33_14845 [Amaricoccus sp.]|nr:hypothetical protein [Amaricoccus sp.]HMQ94494.1 hypothetical protein [Amaricoccus sp.]HMU00627.1 hypothetical protein [Amaricoccus sp.]
MAAAPPAQGFPQAWTAHTEIGGVGDEGDGAGVALADLDGNGVPEMILMAYDDPTGPNSFRYRVGRNLSATGQAASWTGHVQIPGLGNEGDGAGLAVADLDGNGRPEMILMAYDAPEGANNFRFKVGRDLDANGVATSWSGSAQVAGVGDAGEGADIAVGDIDGNGRPDMVLLAYDAPAGANEFRYRVGRDLNGSGIPTGGWSDWRRIAGMGGAGEGAGIALGDFDRSGTLDLIVMAYDAPEGANQFRYRVAFNVATTGEVGSWSPMVKVDGVGDSGQGAGVAAADLNNNGRPEVVLMGYDNPAGPNNFRYRIGQDWDRGIPRIRLSHAPLHPSMNQMVTFRAEADDADGLRRVNILVNARLGTECAGSPCTFVGGPYPEDVPGGFSACSGARLGTSRVDLATLGKGAKICAVTSEGRVAALQFREAVGASPGRMQLAYTVWNTPAAGGAPSVFRRGTFDVRQTWLGDLDGGREVNTDAGADFWFQAETATSRFLVPRNGARYAVVEPSGTYTRPNSWATTNYGANAYDPAGGRGWTGYRVFAVGDYPGRVVPIWFHGSTSQKLDIVFIRDSRSYTSQATFLQDLEGTLLNSYMADELMSANGYRVNFWYIRDTGEAFRNDSDQCILRAPSNFATDASFADSGAIVHATNFRDCASGGIFSSEPTSSRTFMHETGHALFGLADAYCCDGGYWQPAPWPNLYTSSTNCLDDAARQGWPSGRCQSFNRSSDNRAFWVADRQDLMSTCAQGYPSCAPGDFNFDQGSRRRAVWTFDNLP